MKKKNKPRIILFVVSIFLLITIIAAWKIVSSPIDPDNQERVSFSIQKREPLDQIIDRLKKSDLIRSKAAMKLTVLRLGLAKRIQAGEFLLSPSWSLKDIAQTLTLGRSDMKITLIEGWRKVEIAEELDRQFSKSGVQFNKDAFLEATKDSEGYLFPDTYFIPKNSQTEEIADLLLQNFEKKVDQNLQSSINNQGLSLNQALIIASLVEREAKFDKDRSLVAGILIKRWKNNWALEIDATVQYALGYQKKTNTWWKQDLTLSDLKIDSPYNTYLYPGLPPTPICSPSLASIQAVGNQQQSEYWFYISDIQGNLHFAKTLSQHNANIAKYLNK